MIKMNKAETILTSWKLSKFAFDLNETRLDE